MKTKSGWNSFERSVQPFLYWESDRCSRSCIERNHIYRSDDLTMELSIRLVLFFWELNSDIAMFLDINQTQISINLKHIYELIFKLRSPYISNKIQILIKPCESKSGSDKVIYMNSWLWKFQFILFARYLQISSIN